MKQAFYSLLAFLLLIVLSCKKEVPFYYANSCMSVKQKIMYVDSVIEFINCSDTKNVEYKWKFGDGNTSNEVNPTHIYRNNGKYIVTLSTYVNKIVTDSTSKEITLLIGAKYFDFSEFTFGIEPIECLDNSIIVYGWSTHKYFFAKFDKTLRKKWIKYIDKEPNFNFSRINRTSDGNFIIPGSLTSIGNYSLSKIDTSCNLLWEKSYNQINGHCQYAVESLDGGIISIGIGTYSHSSGNTIYCVTVLKTDTNGNFEWKKDFDKNLLMESNNIISTVDGYVFASSTTGSCLNCEDSLVITKLNLSGNIEWKVTKDWQVPGASTETGARGSSIAINNNFIVAINDANESVFIFDLNGNFIKRYNSNLVRNHDIISLSSNKFILRGDSFNLNCLDFKGENVWSLPFGNRIDGCPSSNIINSFKPLTDGNIVILGRSQKKCYSNDMSMFLVKINEKGEIQ